MNREKFLDSIAKTYSDGIETIKKKNADYAGENDPFQNFRNSEVIGVSVEEGILVRVMDKITRISNLLSKDPQVATESIEDTLIDAINYLAILKAYRESKTP